MDAAWVFAHTIIALDTVADPDWAIFYIARNGIGFGGSWR